MNQPFMIWSLTLKLRSPNTCLDYIVLTVREVLVLAANHAAFAEGRPFRTPSEKEEISLSALILIEYKHWFNRHCARCQTQI